MKHESEYSNTSLTNGKAKVIPLPGSSNEFNLDYVTANEIPILQQPWLWDGFIPLETCTLIAGRGGIGKSQFLMHLASLVSNGSKFKINSLEYQIAQGSILILSAEDHLSYTIAPRLRAVDADLSRIHIVTSAINKANSLDERFIKLDTDLNLIESLLKKIKDVKLIIIDPITAYIGNIRENRSSEVRSFILRLNRLAEKNKLAIILNTHTRKQASGESATSASDEIMGSSAWANTVRQAFSITRDHEDDNRFLFIVSKTNYKKPEGLAYRIQPHLIDIGGQEIEVSRIEWMNGKVDITADEAINKHTFEKRLEIDRAKDFLKRILGLGSQSRKKIFFEASQDDIDESTLKRARRSLEQQGIKIVSEKGQFNGKEVMWYIAP